MDHIKISNKLLEDVVDLAFTGMQKVRLFKKNPPSRSGMKKKFRGYIRASLTCGVFDYLYEKDKLVAFFIFTKTEFAPGLPFAVGTLDCNGTKAAVNWIKDKLAEYQLLFNFSSHFELPIHLKRLLPHFFDAGFSIDSVKLMGVPKDCLNKFKGRGRDHSKLDELGLKLSRAAREDLSQVMDIESREFTRNPQYGHFVANEKWLKDRFQVRTKALESEKSFSYVLKNKRGKVVGHFGADIIKTPDFGNLGTPEFLFDKSIQGKGLSKIGYQILLEDMSSHGADFFMGNTAQLGVLRNAKKMGRVPINFFLRYSPGYFAADYFLQNI